MVADKETGARSKPRNRALFIDDELNAGGLGSVGRVGEGMPGHGTDEDIDLFPVQSDAAETRTEKAILRRHRGRDHTDHRPEGACLHDHLFLQGVEAAADERVPLGLGGMDQGQTPPLFLGPLLRPEILGLRCSPVAGRTIGRVMRAGNPKQNRGKNSETDKRNLHCSPKHPIQAQEELTASPLSEQDIFATDERPRSVAPAPCRKKRPSQTPARR